MHRASNQKFIIYISYKDRKAVVSDLKPIYTAVTEDEVLFAFVLFGENWNAKYPLIAKSWQANWQRISLMIPLPKEIRRAFYTTNVIEYLNYYLRRITKTRAAFPNEEAALKLLYLCLQNAARKWTMPIQNWSLAMNQMAILFEGRMLIPGLTKNSFTQKSDTLLDQPIMDFKPFYREFFLLKN